MDDLGDGGGNGGDDRWRRGGGRDRRRGGGDEIYVGVEGELRSRHGGVEWIAGERRILFDEERREMLQEWLR